jgi:hypothetical protein
LIRSAPGARRAPSHVSRYTYSGPLLPHSSARRLLTWPCEKLPAVGSLRLGQTLGHSHSLQSIIRSLLSIHNATHNLYHHRHNHLAHHGLTKHQSNQPTRVLQQDVHRRRRSNWRPLSNALLPPTRPPPLPLREL